MVTTLQPPNRSGQLSQASRADARTMSVTNYNGKSHMRNGLMLTLSAVGIAAGFLLPWFGSLVSHGFDRIRNGLATRKEMNLRTQYYARQIGETLGIDPAKVTQKDFKRAASINPGLAKLYNEPLKKQKEENSSSLVTNGSVAAISGIVPVLKEVAHVAKAGVEGVKGIGSVSYLARGMIGGMQAGALGTALSREKLDAQELTVALDKGVTEASERGAPRSQAVNAQLIFALRVAQDERLSQEIEKRYGKKLHKMQLNEINSVMQDYGTLAAASERDANAVIGGSKSMRDIGASTAGQSVTEPTGGFVQREMARRAANNNEIIANDNGGVSFTDRVEASRARGPQGLNA